MTDRISKDGLLVNAKNRKFIIVCSLKPLICETFNMFIVNGRYKGDKSREFTFLNERGASVIDFLLCGLGSWKCVKSFYV